ncbi:MAG: hypothetical protein KAH04_07970 [Psychrilyobacter sp.]|nr:hypothetical protein [Psychrilyobacter sp.]
MSIDNDVKNRTMFFLFNLIEENKDINVEIVNISGALCRNSGNKNISIKTSISILLLIDSEIITSAKPIIIKKTEVIIEI